MSACPFCKRQDVFYENYQAEKKTFKLWNCIACGFIRKVKKEKVKILKQGVIL